MGLETALLVGSLAASVGGSVMQAQGAKAAGKAAKTTSEYNASISERNAKVAENEARYRKQRGDYEVAQFSKDFRAMQAAAATRFRKSGVVMSGTPLKVLAESAAEADEEKKTIALLAQTDAGRMEEKARSSRLQGQLTLLEGRQKQQAYNMQARSAMFSAVTSAAMGGYRISQALPSGTISGGLGGMGLSSGVPQMGNTWQGGGF